MQAYDIIMLIVLGATTFIGFRKGLVWQIASVAAIVLSYLVAVQFRDVIAQRIDAQPPWNTFLAMLILYVATSFVIWLVFQLVRGVIDKAKLKDFDRQLGAVFGLAKGALLCVIITLFAVTLLDDNLRQQVIRSRSGLYIAQLLDKADSVMPTELHDFLHPYLDRLDEGLKGGPETAPESDEFRELERWLENGQGGETRLGAGSGARISGDAPAADPFYQPPREATPYRADADRQSRYRVLERR